MGKCADTSLHPKIYDYSTLHLLAAAFAGSPDSRTICVAHQQATLETVAHSTSKNNSAHHLPSSLEAGTIDIARLIWRFMRLLLLPRWMQSSRVFLGAFTKVSLHIRSIQLVASTIITDVSVTLRLNQGVIIHTIRLSGVYSFVYSISSQKTDAVAFDFMQ
jgi:hypothetical protein